MRFSDVACHYFRLEAQIRNHFHEFVLNIAYTFFLNMYNHIESIIGQS